jgi:hypothetical protein
MTDRRADELAAMDEAEVDDVPFDFTGHLLGGETITSAQIVVLWLRGTPDDSAQAMADGGPSIGVIDGDGLFVIDPAGAVVLQRFAATGRPVRAVYSLRCTVTLSSGRKLTAAGHMAIRRL